MKIRRFHINIHLSRFYLKKKPIDNPLYNMEKISRGLVAMTSSFINIHSPAELLLQHSLLAPRYGGLLFIPTLSLYFPIEEKDFFISMALSIKGKWKMAEESSLFQAKTGRYYLFPCVYEAYSYISNEKIMYV